MYAKSKIEDRKSNRKAFYKAMNYQQNTFSIFDAGWFPNFMSQESLVDSLTLNKQPET